MGHKMILDTKGLRCPMPVLKARKALKALGGDEVLTVLATDPKSVEDFQAFCDATGAELLSVTVEDGVYTFEIRKSEV